MSGLLDCVPDLTGNNIFFANIIFFLFLNNRTVFDFDLLKVKVKNRFFSNIEKAPPLTRRRRLSYCASKSVQPFRLYACLRA